MSLSSGRTGQADADCDFPMGNVCPASSTSDLGSVQFIAREMSTTSADEKKKHLLFHSVMKAHRDQVERLVSSVDIAAADNKGNSAMHFWARSTISEVHLIPLGEFLLNAGADINAQRGTDGMTPLHFVVLAHNNRRGWWDFHKARFLIQRGASVAQVTAHGQTPLDLLRVDMRGSTQELLRLLRPAIRSSVQADLPACRVTNCVWCS